MRLFDRSRVTTDLRCRRRRYWNYEHNGTGITSGNSAYELYFGTLVHDALAAIATFHRDQNGKVPLDDIANAGGEQIYSALISGDPTVTEYANEQKALVEGLIRGFHRYVWPKLLDLYPEIVVIEQEVLTPYGFMVKPDLILQTTDGTLVYVEYKTTSNKSDKWKDSWAYSPQLHAYMRAIKDALDINVAAAVVVGLYKGYESYGRQNSPFCYAHSRAAQPPFFEQELLYTYKAGYKKTPSWELPGGVKDWVTGMPLDVMEEQFPIIPPVYPNEGIADAFFRQAAIREKEIETGLRFLPMAMGEVEKQAIMDAWFAQNFEACRPSFGSHCPYASICLDGVSADDSRWQPREPHHSSEKALTSQS